MSNAEEGWPRKTDDQVFEASSRLSEHTHDGQRIILSETNCQARRTMARASDEFD
jgi:hypothetical protein